MVARGLCTSMFPLLFTRSFARAATVQIDDFDPRITYNTPILSQDICENRPDNYACAGNWWYELGNKDGGDYNNSIHDTFGPATTATLQFQGSAISVYGVTLDAGAKGTVVIDGGTPDLFSSVSSDGTLRPQQLLYSKGGLNPAINHQIIVAYDESSFGPADNRRWLGIDYFAIDTSGVPSTPTISTSTATGSLSTSSTGRSDHTAARRPRSHSKTGIEVTAGGVAGGIALVAIGAAGLFLIRRHFREVDERHLGHNPTPQMAAFAHSTLAASQHIRPYHGYPSSCPDTSWSAPTPFLAPPSSSGPPTSIASSSQLGSETVELVSQPPPYSPVAGSVPLPVDTMINVPEISKLS
ncbi:hypothetical protein EXIGLDRAFT_847790 [Exidia glandulosa HHB12029]|uniref:Uncharacterized protein n=1 Tax=Exidia glandulosa HHB12029 TaxID=1314781 RepID=A0A166MKB1_EXIGL|nr:hypothetical protein EXIGLDRAFT_847790 [Exidia glandulosa HHB12029]